MAYGVARAILFVIFGFFIYETINEFNKLSDLSLNLYFAFVPTILVYVFQEFLIRKMRANEKAAQIIKPQNQNLIKSFTSSLGFLW